MKNKWPINVLKCNAHTAVGSAGMCRYLKRSSTMRSIFDLNWFFLFFFFYCLLTIPYNLGVWCVVHIRIWVSLPNWMKIFYFSKRNCSSNSLSWVLLQYHEKTKRLFNRFQFIVLNRIYLKLPTHCNNTAVKVKNVFFYCSK